MPKKLKFESFKYRFLIAAEKQIYAKAGSTPTWSDFVNDLQFSYQGERVLIESSILAFEPLEVELTESTFYTRGDNPKSASNQKEKGFLDSEDPVKLKNEEYFAGLVAAVAAVAGYKYVLSGACDDHKKRIQNEREFHDAWAQSEAIQEIDVRGSNEVCTAPEMRFIVDRLGKLNGKRLLDVGCGLGEASVYFAILGADVTSTDLSQGMLDATWELARLNGVSVKRHLASAEDMQLPVDARFDIIYAGNLLHHVDIDKTLSLIRPHLADDGILVTWDPLAYNPAINVYRSLATEVRTPDEHPLKLSDIKTFNRYFSHVETKYFWLFTLVIFVLMFVAQRRNPNKERFWKVILKEGERWSWLYRPLEKLDTLVLKLLPPLRLLCWNVVIVARK